jgi:deoxyxylulose-5-phosphate synthase
MFAAAELLREDGIRCTTLRLLSVTDYSREELAAKVQGKHVFFIEEVCAGSGISDEISMILNQRECNHRIHAIDLGNQFVTHGDAVSLYRMTGVDHESIANTVREVLRNEN